MKWETYEDIYADLQVARIDRPKPAPEPAAVKAEERWAAKHTEAVIQDATRGNDALARRMQQERKEMAQYNADGQDPRVRYQRELDAWQQSKLDAETALDDGYVEIAGFRERRYRTTCHRGCNDPDWGL